MISPIRDAIHDHIRVKGVAEDLIDTPIFQRLRDIKQLGTANFVYPSANHTRFEHSLGVYYLADKVAMQLSVDDQECECLRAAALLHDVGHGPYSHATEPILKRHLDTNHDEIRELISSGQVRNVLEDYGIDFNKIADLVQGKRKYGQIIAGVIDVDRMDYLQRDAHHAGVKSYGKFDQERLLTSLTLTDSELAVRAENKHVAEAVLIARTRMRPKVYFHHTARIAEMMLLRATESLVNHGSLSPESLREYDDSDLKVKIRNSHLTSQFAKRLDNRNLFKRAIWLNPEAFSANIGKYSYKDIRTCEREIAQEADVNSKEVILDMPNEPDVPESSAKISVDGKIELLSSESVLVNALKDKIRKQRRVGCYTNEENIEDIRKAVVKILGIRTNNKYINKHSSEYTSR